MTRHAPSTFCSILLARLYRIEFVPACRRWIYLECFNSEDAQFNVLLSLKPLHKNVHATLYVKPLYPPQSFLVQRVLKLLAKVQPTYSPQIVLSQLLCIGYYFRICQTYQPHKDRDLSKSLALMFLVRTVLQTLRRNMIFNIFSTRKALHLHRVHHTPL